MSYPILYVITKSGRHLNLLAFALVFWKSIFQAAVIFIASVGAFGSVFNHVITVSYSSVVLVELLNLLLLLRTYDCMLILTFLVSSSFYIFSFLAFRRRLGLQKMTLQLLYKIGVISFLCWGPFKLMEMLRVACFPSIQDKILKDAVKSDSYK